MLKLINFSFKLSKNRGFTLIELLVVIAIIAIISSIAMTSYKRYQLKAKVSAYAEPHARACLLDLISYCINHPGTTITDSVVQKLSNCKNLKWKSTPTPDSTLYVSLTVDSNKSNVYSDPNDNYNVRSKNLACNVKGQVNDTNGNSVDVTTLLIGFGPQDTWANKVSYYINYGTPYYAECSYTPNSGIKCYITTNPADK